MAVSEKVATARREQVIGALERGRLRRLAIEAELKTIRDSVPAQLLDGAELGITYEELADYSGYSRPRIAQMLAAARAEASEGEGE